MGSSVELICPETIEKWDGIYGFPVSGDRVYLGLAQLVVMRVYTEVVQPRPPGNLHVGQTVEITSAPFLNESMVGEVRCSEKCLKGDRKLVVFQVDVSGHESAAYLFKGKISIFWAG